MHGLLFLMQLRLKLTHYEQPDHPMANKYSEQVEFAIPERPRPPLNSGPDFDKELQGFYRISLLPTTSVPHV